MGSMFPPLAGSDFLLADPERSIRIVLGGLSGPIVVNGAKFDAVMPSFAHLGDREIADVLTFVRSSFGNRAPAIRAEDVATARARSASSAP
jgi:nitrite reductase (NO-forming)